MKHKILKYFSRWIQQKGKKTSIPNSLYDKALGNMIIRRISRPTVMSRIVPKLSLPFATMITEAYDDDDDD